MKEKLSNCVTMQDSHTVLSELDTIDLNSFVNALNKVKEYIHITMRDEFLLNQAAGILINRGYVR